MKATKTLKKVVHQYVALFEPDPSGGYTVSIPSLPGCISEGDTFEEALANIHEAAELYIDVMKHQRRTVRSSQNGTIVAPVMVRG